MKLSSGVSVTEMGPLDNIKLSFLEGKISKEEYKKMKRAAFKKDMDKTLNLYEHLQAI